MTSNPLPWLLPLIDFAFPALLCLLGILFIRRTLKARYRTDILTCAKCNYDMRAASSLTCPECGYIHPSKANLHPGKRRIRRKVAGGLLLCLPALCILLFSLYYYPVTYLQNRRTAAILAPLVVIDPKFEPWYAWSLSGRSVLTKQPPIWTVRIAELVDMFNPSAFELYFGGPPGYEILAMPRSFDGHPVLALTQTFTNWTWNPAANYTSYLPRNYCTSIQLGFTHVETSWLQPAFPAEPPRPFTAAAAANLTQLPDLDHLKIGPTVFLSDDALARLAAIPATTHTVEIHRFIPDAAQSSVWDTVPSIPALTSITIDARQGIPPQTFKMLLACRKLKSITIVADPARPDPALAQDCLKLANLNEITLRGINLNPSLLHNLKQNPQLYALTLDMPTGSPLQDEHLSWIASDSDLFILNINNAPNLTGAFLDHLPKKIARLSLFNLGLNDAGLAHLNHHPVLRQLQLQNTNVTVEGLKSFLQSSTPILGIQFDKPLDAQFCQIAAAHPTLTSLTLVNLDEPSFQHILAANLNMEIRLYQPNLTPDTLSAIRQGKYNVINKIQGGYSRRIDIIEPHPAR